MGLRKFLIISTYAPPAVSGAPLMMYNLLQHFPENSFCILTGSAAFDEKVRAVSVNQLPCAYYFFDKPILTFLEIKKAPFFQRLKAVIRKIKLLRGFAQIIHLTYIAIKNAIMLQPFSLRHYLNLLVSLLGRSAFLSLLNLKGRLDPFSS